MVQLMIMIIFIEEAPLTDITWEVLNVEKRWNNIKNIKWCLDTSFRYPRGAVYYLWVGGGGGGKVCTVLKSPWILGEVLEKYLNSIFPWRFLKFLCKSLNFLQHWLKYAEKWFLMLFGCPRQNINHSSENLKVIYIKRFLFYAIINYQ